MATKDMLPIDEKLAIYRPCDEVMRESLRHPMSTHHIDDAQRAIGLVAEILGLDNSIGPIAMILTCPSCKTRHIDEGEFATKHHHTHACQACGMVWRPAIVATVGVQFLPGFKNSP
jgi:hypothetical protein